MKYFFLALILFFALFIRLKNITTPINDNHTWRQMEIYSVAYNFANNDPNIFSPRVFKMEPNYKNSNLYLYEFPFYEYALSLTIRLFGDNILVIRLFSILLTLILTTSIFIIGQKFINTSVGLLAAFVFNLFPTSVFWGRALSHDLFAATLIFTALALVNVKTIISRKTYLSAMLMGIAIATKPTYALFLVPYVYLVAKSYRDKKIFKINTFIIVALIILPEAVWILRRSLVPIEARQPQSYMVFFDYGITYFNYVFKNNVIPFFVKSRLLDQVLTPLGGILLILGTISFVIFKPKYFKFIAYLTLLPFLVLLILPRMNFVHDYYQIQLLPGAAILIAYFLYKTFNFAIKKGLIFVLSILTFLIFSGYYLWKLPYSQSVDAYFRSQANYSDFKTDIDQIGYLVPKDGLVVIADVDNIEGDPALISYIKKNGFTLQLPNYCDLSAWTSRLSSYPYNLASYLIIQKKSFRGFVDTCDSVLLSMGILLKQSEFRYNKLYEGEKLILLQKSMK